MNIQLNSITSSSHIGNSLSSLAFNFNATDQFLYYLNLSADTFFKPMLNFYLYNKTKLDSIITIVTQNSAKWNSVVSLVTENSAKWLTPLVYIHPTIIEYPTTANSLNLVVSSFKKIYPIIPTVSGANSPFFVEDQKAVIYYYTYAIKDTIHDDYIIDSATTHCVSEGAKSASVTCNDSSNGTTKCMGSNASCSGCARSCGASVTVYCNYPETNSANTYRYIRARVFTTFQDRYEKELKAMIYTVKNCEWTFERNLIK